MPVTPGDSSFILFSFVNQKGFALHPEALMTTVLGREGGGGRRGGLATQTCSNSGQPLVIVPQEKPSEHISGIIRQQKSNVRISVCTGKLKGNRASRVFCFFFPPNRNKSNFGGKGMREVERRRGVNGQLMLQQRKWQQHVLILITSG